MKKYFEKIDTVFEEITKNVLGAVMFVLFILTNVQVVYRYILKQNLGGAEELPTFLLIITVWVAGIIVTKNEGHIRIDLIDQIIKDEKIKKILNLMVTLLTAVVSWIFTWLAFKFFIGSLEKHTLSSGMQFPMWYIYIFMVIGSVGMSFYYTVNVFKKLFSIKEGQ